jgi:hypothetical protein
MQGLSLRKFDNVEGEIKDFFSSSSSQTTSQIAGELDANFASPSRRPPFLRSLAQVGLSVGYYLWQLADNNEVCLFHQPTCS